MDKLLPILAEWGHAGVSYSLRPMARGAGALLVATGPGMRLRAAASLLDDTEVAEWLTLPDVARAERAEDLLART